MKTPFLGPAYTARSTNLAFNQAINLQPEFVDSKDGREVAAFYGCPGADLIATIGAGPHRGARVAQANGGLYVVSGNSLYSVGSTFGTNQNLLGTLGTSTGPVSMIDGATQLLIADGTTSVYVRDFSALTFTTVTLPFNVTTLFYQDGFFLANEAGTKQWAQSNLNDGTTWNALNFSAADGQPDPIVGGIDINREAWLMKANGIEVWYNAGNVGFAFARIPGVYMEQGCAAAFSIVKYVTGPIWLGSGERGAGIVWMAEGYRVQRISTHAIETAIAGYSTISDAQAWIYEDSGHTYYVLAFPTGNATWVCDLTEPGHPWHQRAYFSNGAFSRHRMNSYAFAYGREVFGDYQNGNLYAFDLNTYTDAGQTRKWLRSWRALPPNKAAEKPVAYHRLAIRGETGISTPAGTNPQVMLRWSDDGGHTYSPTFQQPMGVTGATALEVQFISLGSTTRETGLDRLFELSGTDPVKVAWIGADLEAA
jgi:hypothetical protein